MSRNDNLNFEIGGSIGGSAEGNQGIYEESSTAKYPLGQKLELIDGRVFRYCNFDAAVTVGKLVGADQSTGAADEISDGTIATGTAGSSVVTLTASGSAGPPADFEGVEANDYAGLICISLTVLAKGSLIGSKAMARLVAMLSSSRFTIRL